MPLLVEIHLGARTLQPGRQLLAGDARIPLGPRALGILSVLARAKGEIVTKDELMEAVWPKTIVEENTLQVHVAALRKALGPEAWRLQTIRGVGYELLIEAQHQPEREAPALLAIPPPDVTTVVVLPFANFSDDHEQHYFADGVCEDIVTHLSKVSALNVVSFRRGLSADWNGDDEMAIAGHFHASHVLEGSVRRDRDRILISTQLVSAATGARIWAERYDRLMADIFDLQEELSRQIVEALKLELLPGEHKALGTRGTQDPHAYEAFLMARALRSIDLDSIRRSLDAYRQALALDPDFADAWAGYATALMQNRGHFRDSGINQGQIDRALQTAIRLAPHLPNVLASRAQNALVSHDWPEVDRCIAEFRNRQLTDWSIFSALLIVRGHPWEAVEHQLRICRAEPFSAGASFILQVVLDCAGRHEEAEAEYMKVRATSPYPPMEFSAFKRAALLFERKTALERLIACLKGPTFLSRAYELAQALDDRDAALAILKSEICEGAEKDPLAMVWAAHIAVFYGETELALRALRIANVEGPINHFTLIDIWHPHFAPLHDKRGFKAILEDIGLIDHCRGTGEWGEFLRPGGNDDFEVTVRRAQV